MKFRITFKTPDTVDYAFKSIAEQLDLPDAGKQQFLDSVWDLVEDYIANGEEAILEFDTDNADVRVRQVRKALKQPDYAIQAWLDDHPGWHRDLISLSKEFILPDFNSAMAFANRIAMWAERHDHHPQLRISWNWVEVIWYTQDVNGITVHDFAGATATDSYYKRQL